MFFNIKLCVSVLSVIGANPLIHSSIIQKSLYGFSLFILCCSMFLCILQFVYEDNSSLNIVLARLESVFLLTDAICKISVLFFNHQRAAKLITDTFKFWNLQNFSFVDEKRTGEFFLKAAKFIAIWYPGIGLIASFSILFGPLVSGEHVLPLSTYVPAYPPYWWLYAVEDHAVIICLIAIGCFDVLLGTLVIMVVVQWKMLNREVKRVIDSTADTDEERCQLKNDIKNCVNHHNFLIDYVQRLNETVWYSNSIVILLAAVTYCVEIFVIVKRPIGEDFSTRLTLLIEYANEFFLFYVIPSQLMSNEAEQTEDFAFSSNWHEHSVDIKKPFINMVSYISRRPVALHAGHFIDFNFTCVLTMYKMVFSYYTFLNKINEEI